MTNPPRFDAQTLRAELSKLPQLIAASALHLNPVHLALSRAVASGQSADQLARDLSMPIAWGGVDLNKAPFASEAGEETAPETTYTQPPTEPQQAWIAGVMPHALENLAITRVVILDRQPTALGGLELPAWARALKPSAVYGPITSIAGDLHVKTPKWILIYTFTETVEFVRQGIVLCVVPVSIFHFGPHNKATIVSGSAWIAAHPFVATAPADSFAGLTVQSGQITSDKALTFSGTTVTVPKDATLDIGLVPTLPAAGLPGFPTQIDAPASISITFPPAGTASIAFDHCAGKLYGEAFRCTPAHKPTLYNSQLKVLFIPGDADQATFKPKPAKSKMFAISGAAPIVDAGWALGVSESTTAATLGAAANSGALAISFSKGIACKWTGAEQPEPALAGLVIAQNNTVVISTISATAPGVLLEQKFSLWDDQDATSIRPCQLIAARGGGQVLLYALAGNTEIVELGASVQARVDRPLLANGARVPAVFLAALVALVRTNSSHSLFVYSATPLPQPTGPNQQPRIYPLALDNALLEITQPLTLLLNANTDANFNATEGLFLLLFGYLLVELYLPDPYTAATAAGLRTFGSVSNDLAGVQSSGFLLANVSWNAPDKAALRLADLAHPHPAIAPATEAESTVVVHAARKVPVSSTPFPISPAVAVPQVATATKMSATVPAAATQKAAVHQGPYPPAPPTPSGATLIDVSTRASQLGVEVITSRRFAAFYTIDGLSVRGPAALLPLTTLPAIAWEPMYNRAPSEADVSVDNFRLLHPPGDGPLTQVRANSANLIPISPLQSLQSVLDAGKVGSDAILTLPFGMVAFLTANTSGGDGSNVRPNLSLVQPVFPATSTPTGSIYTGAWQLSFTAPNPSQPDPVLAGRTYLRTQSDNPAAPDLSYGEQVLGVDVSDIFSSRFNPANPHSPIGTGVPLRRYDLTGYGASTFSEWTNTTPAPTDVLKTFFHVLIGRTSHEVVEVQSIIYPWAIKVVRTITIDRLASGSVERYDSGWQPASDGLFDYPAATGITRDKIHSGLISGVINVRNIHQLGLPVDTTGSPDIGTTGLSPKAVAVQPITFDADVIIQPHHVVTQGGANLSGLNGDMHVCVPSKGITGYIGLEYKYHLSITDMVAFPALRNGAGGPINATLNVGKANSLLRATEFDATPVHDFATSKVGIACAIRGLPKLSSDGSWSVASRTQSQLAPVSIGATKAAPVLQPNQGGSSDPGNEIHFANPADIFRLAAGSSVLPETAYGFLQATGTQSNFLSRPILTVGSDHLTLGDALNVAHAGALLGAISKFPGISQCLQFLGSELDPIQNQLAAPSLATTQNLQLKHSVRANPINLISISIARVDLYFHWLHDDLTVKADPPNVVIALGQPTSPSWSLDVNHIAVALVIPALSSQPVLWLQGGFHADADTTPGFPDLKVVFDGPLKPLTEFMTVLQDIAKVLKPAGGAAHAMAEGDSGGAGLNVHFADGTLTVTDDFSLPSIPLGPGTIEDVSLNIGAALDILGLSIGFMVSIGTKEAPCHWIVDPLSGVVAIGAGVKNNKLDIFIEGGIGLGLAIDLGIASGSASIVIAVSIEISGSQVTLMLLLTGQAQVDVLGGVASAAITLTAGLGLQFGLAIPPKDVTLIGTAAVGIHISICWVVNIDFSGSWTFQKQLALN
ncbi:MAG: hypothetical protein NVSMB62_02810 [Acidobacteriaceae bacterium]